MLGGRIASRIKTKVHHVRPVWHLRIGLGGRSWIVNAMACDYSCHYGICTARRSGTSMNKVVVTKQEIAEMGPVTDSPIQTEPKIGPAIPFPMKAVLAPLVFALPVLCLLAAILKIALRNQPPRIREAWMA